MRRRQPLALALILAACKPSPAPSTASQPEAQRGAEQGAASPAPPPRRDQGPARTPVPLRFVNVTEAAGLTFVHRSGARGERTYLEPHSGGCAVLQADGDEWPDLYLVNGGTLPPDPSARQPNRLFRNRGDGTFLDATSEAGAPGTGYGFGAYPADYDGDGDDDLFVTQYGPDALYRNRGDGTMEEVAGPAGVAGRGWSTGAAWLDADLDGDLDLYVVHYVGYDVRQPKPCWRQGQRYHCGPYDFPGEADELFINGGGGVFEAREIRQPIGKGLGALAWDLDVDGRPDLYVANDETPNHLFINEGGRYRESALVAGVSHNGGGEVEAGMGVDFADYDGDGRADLFVTNFSYETYTLYRGLDRGFFQDVTTGAGLVGASLLPLGFGTRFIDFDNDGDVDLYWANGHVLHNIEVLELSLSYAMANQLLRNDAGHFEDISERVGEDLRIRAVSRGLASADYDDDGDVDLLVTNNNGPVSLLRNDGGNTGNWLSVRLRGRAANRDGIGARIEVWSGARRMVRERTSGGSYLASHDPRVHFGLGTGLADSLRVHWPGGGSSLRREPPMNQTILVEQPTEP